MVLMSSLRVLGLLFLLPLASARAVDRHTTAPTANRPASSGGSRVMVAPITIADELRGFRATPAAQSGDWSCVWRDGRWWSYRAGDQWLWWDGTRWREPLAASTASAAAPRVYYVPVPVNAGTNFGRQDFDVYPNRD
jgi:hypothetical protein